MSESSHIVDDVEAGDSWISALSLALPDPNWTLWPSYCRSLSLTVFNLQRDRLLFELWSNFVFLSFASLCFAAFCPRGRRNARTRIQVSLMIVNVAKATKKPPKTNILLTTLARFLQLYWNLQNLQTIFFCLNCYFNFYCLFFPVVYPEHALVVDQWGYFWSDVCYIIIIINYY